MDYSYSFQDNIPHSTFNSNSKNVLNWIEENHDTFKDPNAYEMVNLFLFGVINDFIINVKFITKIGIIIIYKNITIFLCVFLIFLISSL